MTWLTLVLMACNGDKEITNSVYFDGDGDGFTSEVDCNDGDATVYPEADELCDGLDNDCDGDLDEDAIDAQLFYVDSDGDGFGDPDNTEEVCDSAEGYVDNSEDCDDENASTNPDSFEICDLIDNDCDELIDDEDDNIDPEHVDTEFWYADSDGDFFGETDSIILTCGLSEVGVELGGDCDDSDPNINPNSEEICDGIDNDCNGLSDSDDILELYCDECSDVEANSSIGLFLAESPLVGDDHDSSCAVTGSNDTVVHWIAPGSGEYYFETSADNIALTQSCGDIELTCDSGAVAYSVNAGDALNIILEGDSGDLSIRGASEYVCTDNVDDDLDGLSDCDDEEDCWFDSSCGSLQCPNFVLVDPITYMPINGNNVLTTTLNGSGDDAQASCFSSGGDDITYEYEATQVGCLQVMAYSDDVDVSLAVSDGCGDAELSCDNSNSFVTSLHGTTFGAFAEVDVSIGSVHIFTIDALSASSTEQFSLSVSMNNLTDCNGVVLQ